MNMEDIKGQSGVKSKLVFDYLDAKQEVKKAEEKCEKIKTQIVTKMEFKECNVLFCKDMYASVVPNPKVTVNVSKFTKMVSPSVFMEHATIPVKVVRDLLSAKQADKVLTTKAGKGKLITGNIE